ncbi:MAG: aminodeoxychorismate lyase [Gammaproteobacteria bacterium]
MLVNGRNSDMLPVLDRGLLYGDGLFETISFIDGEAPLWERHMARLSGACRRLGIAMPDAAVLQGEAASLVSAAREVVKILVTRGQGGHGYFPGDGETTRILYARPWPARERDGIRAHLCRTRLATGSPLAGLKSLNRLEQVLAAREAQLAGCEEAILCDAGGVLVEGLMSNLFWVSGGRLFTPSLEQCGVAGVMRDFVLEAAARAGIDVRVVRRGPEALDEAGAVFLTNALGLTRVSECNGNNYDVDAVPIEITAAINTLLKQE